MRKVLFFIIFFVLTCSLSAQDFKIVVNLSNPVSSLTKKEVSKLFLKKTKKWDDAKEVLPIDLVEGSPVREVFSEEIHGKSVSSVKAYWQKKIFTGRAVPPPEKVSDDVVLLYVQENSGAIGYVSKSAKVNNKVKILKITN